MSQHPISVTISSIKSLQMYSCKVTPILPVSLFSPQAISLHTSSMLSFKALLLHIGDDASFFSPFVWTESVVILSYTYTLMTSSSPGFFFSCFGWCCPRPASHICPLLRTLPHSFFHNYLIVGMRIWTITIKHIRKFPSRHVSSFLFLFDHFHFFNRMS